MRPRWGFCSRASRSCSRGACRSRTARCARYSAACATGFRGISDFGGVFFVSTGKEPKTMFEIVNESTAGPVIKVIGVGGGGGHANDSMIERGGEQAES